MFIKKEQDMKDILSVRLRERDGEFKKMIKAMGWMLAILYNT